MSLRIRLSVGSEVIREIEVTNQGHPVTGDHHPGHDDLRTYTVYDSRRGELMGEVDHRRSDGAEVLAWMALETLT